MRRFLFAALLLACPALAQTQAQPAQPQQPTRVAPQTAPRPAAAPVSSGRKLDVNAAPADRFADLPGIGPVRSQAIVEHRPYAELDELVKKKVLPQAVFDRVKDQLALANVNTSSAADLQKTLPGIGEVRAKAIVAGRPYGQPHDLVTKGVLTEALYARIKDVATY